MSSIFLANVKNENYKAGVLTKSETKGEVMDREATAHLSFVLAGLLTILVLGIIGYGIREMATKAMPLGMKPAMCGLTLGAVALVGYDAIAFTSRFAAIHNNENLRPLTNEKGMTKYLIKESARYTVLVKIPTLFIAEKA